MISVNVSQSISYSKYLTAEDKVKENNFGDL